MVEHHQHTFYLVDVSKGVESTLIYLQLDRTSKLPRERASAMVGHADFKPKAIPIIRRETLFEPDGDILGYPVFQLAGAASYLSSKVSKFLAF